MSWLGPTVTASTMIADLELADKVGCHNGLVEILETARFEVPTFRKPRKVGQPQLERVPAIEGRASPLYCVTVTVRVAVWLAPPVTPAVTVTVLVPAGVPALPPLPLPPPLLLHEARANPSSTSKPSRRRPRRVRLPRTAPTSASANPGSRKA